MDVDTLKRSLDNTEKWLDDCLDEADKSADDSDASNNSTTGECSILFENRKKRASKPHSTPLTLKWLEENYELVEGVCIPRSTIYVHYLDFCLRNDAQPVNAASFGKIIRQQFPQITTRRLGTRGQSKYHYYGIGITEISAYYEISYSAKGVQSIGEFKREIIPKQIMPYSPQSRMSILLPKFPSIDDVKLPADVPQEKIMTFLMMYRAHCQRILDTIVRANLQDVPDFLLHFWQGMPRHIVPIFQHPVTAALVGVCDSVLYRTISSVFIPTVTQQLSDSLIQTIRCFSGHIDGWTRAALEGLPKELCLVKVDLSRRFAQLLKRQTSLNHLCMASRSVFINGDVTAQMLDDWLNIDLSSIVKQTLYTMDRYKEKQHEIIANLCHEFERLLGDRAPLETFLEWLEGMVHRGVVQPTLHRPNELRQIAGQFLLMWSCFGTRVIRDMTLCSAPTFGSFHLIHLLFDDYVLHLVESLHSQAQITEFMRCLQGHQTTRDSEYMSKISVKDQTFMCSSQASPMGSATTSTVLTHKKELSPHSPAECLHSDNSALFRHSPASTHCQDMEMSLSPMESNSCQSYSIAEHTNTCNNFQTQRSSYCEAVERPAYCQTIENSCNLISQIDGYTHSQYLSQEAGALNSEIDWQHDLNSSTVTVNDKCSKSSNHSLSPVQVYQALTHDSPDYTTTNTTSCYYNCYNYEQIQSTQASYCPAQLSE